MLNLQFIGHSFGDCLPNEKETCRMKQHNIKNVTDFYAP